MRKIMLAAAVTLPFAALAQTGTVHVSNAWTRATPPGATVGGAYLTLQSAADDRLVGASSPVASKVQIHEMTMDGNVMRMREVAGGLKLPAGQAVTLAPGGYHIMLVGLHAPLKKGETVRLHLTFAHAAPVDVEVPVAALGARSAPGGSAMPGMHMP